jgi:hypothetical protein
MMHLTVPDPANIRVWLFLAVVGGAILVLTWIDIFTAW